MMIVQITHIPAAERRRCSSSHTAYCIVNDEATRMIVKIAGLEDVQRGVGLEQRPCTDVGADGKEGGEKPGEEHQLRTEPNRHTDCQHRRSIVNNLL
jgi:hypothetical protein